MSLAPRIDRLEKNFLINGGMDFFQRSTTAVTIPDITGGQYITSDRWSLRRQGTWNVNPTAARSVTIPSNQRTQYSLSMTGDPSSSSESLTAFQPIESLFARELAGEIISLSVWIRSESALDTRLVLDVPDSENNYSTSTTVFDSTKTNSLTIGQWTQVKFENIALPLTSTLGVRVGIEITNMSVTGSSVEHNITQVMVNQGDKALDFERAGRNIAEELQLCQRYFEKSYDININPGTVTDVGEHLRLVNFMTDGSLFRFTNFAAWFDPISFKVIKRKIPSISVYASATGNIGNISIDSTDWASAAFGAGTTGFKVQNISGSERQSAGNNHRCQWTSDAEI